MSASEALEEYRRRRERAREAAGPGGARPPDTDAVRAAKLIVDVDGVLDLKEARAAAGSLGVDPALLYGLARNQVAHVQLTHAGISRRAFQVLCYAVAKSGKVRTLSLSGNGLGPKERWNLAQVLRRNQSIVFLDLNENALGDQGAITLAGGLVHNPHIQFLYLAFNGVGPQGLYTMAKALVRMYSLLDLELSHNPIGDEGVQALVSAMEAAPRKLQLRALHVNDCNIRNEGALALAALMKATDSLAKLYITDNDITDEGARALLEVGALPNKAVFMMSGIGVSPGRRIHQIHPEPPPLTEAQRSKLKDPDLDDLLRLDVLAET